MVDAMTNFMDILWPFMFATESEIPDFKATRPQARTVEGSKLERSQTFKHHFTNKIVTPTMKEGNSGFAKLFQVLP